MFFDNIEIKQKWFVGQRLESKVYAGVNSYIGSFVTERILQDGFDSLGDIPEELLQNSILFQGYTLELDNQPIFITKTTDIHPVKPIKNHCFLTKRDAQRFIEKLKVEIADYYWGDEEEVLNLLELGFDVDEDFSEISMSLDRRWNSFLEMWHYRNFDGLGFTIFYDDEMHEF
ncbi:hypothetical protein SAMN05880501_101154 [Ureibacillus xyleni]|uniref:Uncharacterized protein n=1 Tax=Ureibacillus xyleni TaxID=614648 RepID=A0A285R9L9_9BACL|nr:hypothetical protein [Ureibacillus xyleni]SOB90399.1 hypothetical protein SAMN05880501_101154 [Ureibacillus xyleni]